MRGCSEPAASAISRASAWTSRSKGSRIGPRVAVAADANEPLAGEEARGSFTRRRFALWVAHAGGVRGEAQHEGTGGGLDVDLAGRVEIEEELSELRCGVELDRAVTESIGRHRAPERVR